MRIERGRRIEDEFSCLLHFLEEKIGTE